MNETPLSIGPIQESSAVLCIGLISFESVQQSRSFPCKSRCKLVRSASETKTLEQNIRNKMSVSQETLDMITAAIKSGTNEQGSLVRSKLTNRLVWNSGENDENDPFTQYLAMIGAIGAGQGQKELEEKPLQRAENCGTRTVLGQINSQQQQQHDGSVVLDGTKGRKSDKKQDKENWRDQWEILKKSGMFCSLCKNNKEGREMYLSHNLKGPNGEVTCPILLECECPRCGMRGHTIAYCPENKTGTSILKMINHHNRI
ncbi:uncharacterized protein LOC134227128 [Armigeres subalbatus]|uniref:uncharacterized protein LOC134227128 n=1 Tax=Armigeres subalbatus TaxID=124917 RepID=UPI002ED3508C